ncbi:MAG: TIGR03905 family TSCPD domain-containing protein [Oscillospiraceae bacterium]
MTITFHPQGVCSRKMEIEVEDNTVTSLKVTGGCHGNLQGISALVQGMPVAEVIKKLEGIHCGMKSTSCPDQLTKALRQAQIDGKIG